MRQATYPGAIATSGTTILREPKIVRVQPATDNIALTWNLGSRCNYDCMYCPSTLHDSVSAHADLEKLKNAWNIFYSKTKHLQLPYKLSFTGGEVTANKSFLPFLQYLQQQNIPIDQIIVSSNGSASFDYYKKLCSLITDISLSVHSEFVDEQQFFDKVAKLDALMIRPKKSLHVCIMDEYWNQSRIEIYKKYLEKHNISYSINQIDYDLKIRDNPLMQGKYNLEPI